MKVHWTEHRPKTSRIRGEVWNEYEEPDKSQLFLNFLKTLVAHLRNTEFYDELDLFSVLLRCLDGQRVDERAKCAFLWNTGCKCDIHQNETCSKMKQASKHPSICTFSTDAGFAPVVCNYTYRLCSFCNKLPCAGWLSLLPAN